MLKYLRNAMGFSIGSVQDQGSRQTARHNTGRILGAYDSTTDYTRSAIGAYVGTGNQLPSLIEQTKVKNPFGF
jgi:hypothetical protein